MAPKKTNTDTPGQPMSFPGDGKKAVQPAVKMNRDPVYGEPTTADVHPDEVAHWQEHGWEIAE